MKLATILALCAFLAACGGGEIEEEPQGYPTCVTGDQVILWWATWYNNGRDKQDASRQMGCTPEGQP